MRVNTWLITFSPPRALIERLIPKPVAMSTDESKRAKRHERKGMKTCPSPGCNNKRQQCSTGLYASYCRECLKVRSAAAYQRGRKTTKKQVPQSKGPENEQRRRKRLGLCAIRGCDNPRHTFPSGRVITRCISCEREGKRQEWARRVKRL